MQTTYCDTQLTLFHILKPFQHIIGLALESSTDSITQICLGPFPRRTNRLIVGLALLGRRCQHFPFRRRCLFQPGKQGLVALLQVVDAVEELALRGHGLFVRLLPEGDAVEMLVRGGGEMGISPALDVLADLEDVVW